MLEVGLVRIELVAIVSEVLVAYCYSYPSGYMSLAAVVEKGKGAVPLGDLYSRRTCYYNCGVVVVASGSGWLESMGPWGEMHTDLELLSVTGLYGLGLVRPVLVVYLEPQLAVAVEYQGQVID